MSKTGKTLSIIGAVLAAVVIVVLLLPWLIDAGSVRAQIERMVSEGTGLELRLARDPRLRLLPRPRLAASEITLAGTAARLPQLRLQARDLTLDLALLPLLVGRLQPAEVVVDGFDLRLPPGPPGVGQWRLGAEQIRLLPGADPLPPPDSATPPAIHRIEVRGGWAERSAPSTVAPLRISRLELLGGPFSAQQAGPVTARGHLQVPGIIAGAIGLEGELGPGPMPLLLTGDGLRIGRLRDVSLRLQARIAPVAGGLNAGDLQLTAADMRVDGELRLRNPWTPERPPVLAGRLNLAELDLRTWLSEHGLTGLPGSPETLRRVAITTDLALVPARLAPGGAEPASLRLDQTRIDVDQTRADGSFALQSGIDQRRFAFDVRMDQLDLDPWLTPPAQEPPTAAPSTPMASIAASPATPRQAAQKPAPTAAPEAPIAQAPRSAPTSPPEPAGPSRPPISTLIDGRLQVGRLGLAGLSAEGVGVQVVGEDRTMDLELAVARLLGGTLAGDLHLDGSDPAEPRFRLRAAADGVALGPLFQARFGSAPVTGTADIGADLRGMGVDAPSVRQSLAGTLTLEAHDGRIRGIGIAGDIIRAAGGGQQSEDVTVFSRLSATAQGEQGRFRSDDIEADSPMLAVTGRGALDLPAERIDLTLTSVLREPPSGAGVAELEGLPIPVHIAGDWQRPQVKVDLGPALREAGRRALGRGLDRHSEKLEDLERRTGIPGLEQGLRGLLGL